MVFVNYSFCKQLFSICAKGNSQLFDILKFPTGVLAVFMISFECIQLVVMHPQVFPLRTSNIRSPK